MGQLNELTEVTESEQKINSLEGDSKILSEITIPKTLCGFHEEFKAVTRLAGTRVNFRGFALVRGLSVGNPSDR